MSKRRRLAAAPYYQEWHIERVQADVGVDEEWYIDVPMPLQGAPNGLYWAIELRSVIYKIYPFKVQDATDETAIQTQVCCTSSPRYGKTPFITGPSHPDNIWWYNRRICRPKETLAPGTIFREESRATNKCELTDHKGTGKLLVGPHLFLQIATSDGSEPDYAQHIELCFEYNYTLVKCQQMLGVYQGRLSEA